MRKAGTGASRAKIETVRVKIADLNPYPGNPRTHDIPLIQESLRHLGQYRAIVVRKKDMMILAGHGTTEAAAEEGWKELDAHLIECDDEQARRIVLMDNAANDRAGYNEPALKSILSELDGDYLATGFAQGDLDRMLARTAPPDPTPAKVVQTWEVLVVLPTEESQKDLIDQLEREGYECRAVLQR